MAQKILKIVNNFFFYSDNEIHDNNLHAKNEIICKKIVYSLLVIA
jgi:hypothetical protein